jgi:hypothetical protein
MTISIVSCKKVLIDNPETGNVIPGSGGIRKVRWRAPGRGKMEDIA